MYKPFINFILMSALTLVGFQAFAAHDSTKAQLAEPEMAVLVFEENILEEHYSKLNVYPLKYYLSDITIYKNGTPSIQEIRAKIIITNLFANDERDGEIEGWVEHMYVSQQKNDCPSDSVGKIQLYDSRKNKVGELTSWSRANRGPIKNMRYNALLEGRWPNLTDRVEINQAQRWFLIERVSVSSKPIIQPLSVIGMYLCKAI